MDSGTTGSSKDRRGWFHPEPYEILCLCYMKITLISHRKHCNWSHIFKRSIFELKDSSPITTSSFRKDKNRKNWIISSFLKLLNSVFDLSQNGSLSSWFSINKNAFAILHIVSKQRCIFNTVFRNSWKTPKTSSKIISIHHGGMICNYNRSCYFLSPVKVLFNFEHYNVREPS